MNHLQFGIVEVQSFVEVQLGVPDIDFFLFLCIVINPPALEQQGEEN